MNENTIEREIPAHLKWDIQPVKWDQMVIDPAVQRALDQTRVDRMALNWDPNAAGTPTVSKRANGTHVLLDGQHRRASAIAIGSGDETILCKCFYDLTLAQEAELFALLNTTKKPSPIDLHRVRVVSGDPQAVAVDALLKRVGLEVKSSGAHCFRAINNLYRLYEASPQAAERTLLVLVSAFGAPNDRGNTAVDARLVEGLGLVMKAFGDSVELDRMQDKLSKQAGGAGGLIGSARALAAIRRFTVPFAVADIAIEAYNTNRRTNVLAKLK